MPHVCVVIRAFGFLSILSLAFLLAPVGFTEDGESVPTSPFAGLRFREIGPATPSGRIDDFAVLESNPAIFYVATATGGLWKTVNHGTTFTTVFDNEADFINRRRRYRAGRRKPGLGRHGRKQQSSKFIVGRRRL